MADPVAPWEVRTDPRGRPLQQTEERPGAWKLVIDHYPRCWKCGKCLFNGSLTRPWDGACPRCNEHNCSADAEPAVLE